MIKVRTILENSTTGPYEGGSQLKVLSNLENELIEYMEDNDYMQVRDVDYSITPQNALERKISVEVEVEKK